MKRIVLIMTLAFVCNCTANSQTKKASTRSSSTVSIDDADGVKKEEYVIDRNDSTIFFKIENSQLMFLKINGDKIPTADYAKYMPLVNTIRTEYKANENERAERVKERIADMHNTIRKSDGTSYSISYSPNNKGMLTDDTQTRYYGEKYEIVVEQDKIIKLYYEGKEVAADEIPNHKEACDRVMRNAMKK